MMTPEDVLLDAIKAADECGDTPSLREEFCDKLRESLRRCEMFGVRWNAVSAQRDDGRHQGA